jgi:hypothetical protein
MLALGVGDRGSNPHGVILNILCSCGVAANHEALSRLRLGFESRQEHFFIFFSCWKHPKNLRKFIFLLLLKKGGFAPEKYLFLIISEEIHFDCSPLFLVFKSIPIDHKHVSSLLLFLENLHIHFFL